MGMRCSQPQGLPVHAKEFLKDNAVRVNECPHCHRHDGYKREAFGKYGMDDELELYRYTLLDGSTATEFVQEEMWSSGPIIWIALKWKDTRFRWTNGEVDNDNELVDYGMTQEASYYEDIRRRDENRRKT